MQLLAKINEDGTDLSMETWLDSAFILPFKVVRYCNIYINYYVSKKNRCYMYCFYFFKEPRTSHLSIGYQRKVAAETDYQQRKVYYLHILENTIYSIYVKIPILLHY